MRSLAKYISFDSYAYTDVRRMRFAPNCSTSPGVAGPKGSSYEDYSVTKNTEEKLIKLLWHILHCSKHYTNNSDLT